MATATLQQRRDECIDEWERDAGGSAGPHLNGHGPPGRHGLSGDPEALKALEALVELLEPLGRWIAVTRSASHRLELALEYVQSVPQDAGLVSHLYTEGACLVAEGLQDWERGSIIAVMEARLLAAAEQRPERN